MQHQKRKQQQIIGIVQPTEMALNISLFKQAGFLAQDAEPVSRHLKPKSKK